MLPFDFFFLQRNAFELIYVYINKSFFIFLSSFFTFDLICIAQVDLEFA